jgi:hypothetical protein
VPVVRTLSQMNPGHALQFHIIKIYLNPLHAELNPICHLLALLAHPILHISRIRVNSIAKQHVTFDNVLVFYYLQLAAPRLTPKAGGPPFFEYPLLIFQYIRR